MKKIEKTKAVLKRLHRHTPVAFVKKGASILFYALLKKKIFQIDQRAYWSERAKNFKDEVGAAKKDRYYKRYNETILDKIRTLKDVNSVLEVGCYYGYRLSLLKRSFPDKSLIGCDFGHQQLIICKQKFVKNNNVRLVNCDAAYLPFKDNSFDLVFTSACLQHIPHSDIDQVIKEFKRVSKKYLLLVEAYLNHMFLRKKLEFIDIDYFYMHDYEKILKKHGVQKLEVLGIPDENGHCRYSLFLYSK